MKYLLIITCFFCSTAIAQTSIYDMQVQTKSSKSVSLQGYKGKKILIACVAAQSLQEKESFVYWDSLQVAYPQLAIVIIPANDVDVADGETVKEVSVAPSSSKTLVSALVAVKKDKGERQDPVMQWLTHAAQNIHFDADVAAGRQIYIISESGELYAVLGNGVSDKTITELLNQEDIKQ